MAYYFFAEERKNPPNDIINRSSIKQKFILNEPDEQYKLKIHNSSIIFLQNRASDDLIYLVGNNFTKFYGDE